MKHVYFPGLNALRGYAALSVVVWHVWGFGANWFNLPSDEPLISRFILTGTDAVTLFYVLSGFLLTYLLVNEKGRTGRIDTRAFYVRRARRILPLYYVVLALSTVFGVAWTASFPTVFSAFQHPDKVAATALLMANIPFALGSMGILVHFWSVGVEWQFYMLCPRIVASRHMVLTLLGIIVARLLLLRLSVGIDELYNLVLYFKIDALAVGGIFAWCWRECPKITEWLTTRPVRAVLITVLTSIVVIETPVHNPILDAAMALIFGTLVLNIASGRFVVEHKLTHWLGSISYGIYLWHILVMFLLAAFGLRDDPLYAATVCITLGLATLTHRYIERPFLKLKSERATDGRRRRDASAVLTASAR